MAQVVKVGFVGAGSLANRMHYPSLAEIPEARIEAICDLDEARLARTADRYAVDRRYTDYHRMLREVDLDAVYVVMPTLEPFPSIVVDCLDAGKHVFMEKPPGVTAAACQRMLDAAERNGRKTMVGFNRRFAAVIAEARRRVADEGPISECLAEFHKNMLATGSYWGVSILVTDVIHAVDTLRFVCGEPAEVVSYCDRAYADWTNVYNALIRFDTGAVGLLTANRAAGSRYERFEMHGRGISAYIRAPEEAEIWRDGEKEPERLRGAELRHSEDARVTYGYLAESRHFIDCLLQDRMPTTSLQDAIKTMHLVEAIEAGGTRKR